MKPSLAKLADITQFDAIIDVRSPAEFAEDHLPGAINCPVLDDAQRAEIGTLYKQVSPFAAKKLGAAYVSEAIARHLRERFLEHDKTWRPLIYCWRGGQRSGSMVTVFRAIGWPAAQLEGGYKSYRQSVIETLAGLPARYRYRVLCGATGSAKTRILQAIARRGAQVLDLETLACHKGSVLGPLPDQPQPSQKRFDSLLATTLGAFSAEQPVYVEAESRKIGNLQLPDALIHAIRAGECLEVDASHSARIDFLLEDYRYFVSDPDALRHRLGFLQSQQGAATLARWQGLIDSGDWPALVGELLTHHYDPHYRASQGRNYQHFANARRFGTERLDEDGINALADAMLC